MTNNETIWTDWLDSSSRERLIPQWAVESLHKTNGMFAYSIPADLAWLAENVGEWTGYIAFECIRKEGSDHVFTTQPGPEKAYTHDQWLRTRQDLGLTTEHTEQEETMNLTIGDYVNTTGMGWDEFNWTVEQFEKAGAPVGGNCRYVPESGQTKNLLLWDGMSLHHTTDRNQGSKKRDVTGWMHAEWGLHLSEQLPVTEEEEEEWRAKTETSDGSTASYYELPPNATQLQHLISHRNMNAQIGEVFRACYRYGQASHSDQLRDAKKIAFYANAEIERLEALK